MSDSWDGQPDTARVTDRVSGVWHYEVAGSIPANRHHRRDAERPR